MTGGAVNNSLSSWLESVRIRANPWLGFGTLFWSLVSCRVLVDDFGSEALELGEDLGLLFEFC